MGTPGDPASSILAAPVSGVALSPQLIEYVNVSLVPATDRVNPGSVKTPMLGSEITTPTVAVWLPTTRSVGATFVTVTWKLPVAVPPSSSATVTVTVYVPLSAYTCWPSKDASVGRPMPPGCVIAGTPSLAGVPSPQLTE